jgi:putative ABC transport system permease protein
MLNATLESLLSRKLRLLLSGLAVVFGVMAVSGALFLTDSLGRSFDALFQTIDGNIDVQVNAKPHLASSAQTAGAIVALPIPASVVDRVAGVPGVQQASGTVAADGARVIGPDGKVIPTQGPPRLGTAWRSGSTLIELRHGRGPEAPDEVAINANLARLGRFAVGSQIPVLTRQPKRTFTVVGIFGYPGGRDSIGGETIVAFTEPVAQQLMLGQTGVFTGINVTAKRGVSPTKLRDDVAAALGGDYQVRTGKQVAADDAKGLQQFIDVIRNVLLGFAGVTLFVGVFLILNTFSILVAQRTRELALFRALGASRGQVLGSVLVEALVIGLVASTIGVLAGFGLGALLRKLFEANGGSSLPSPGAGVPAAPIVAGYAVGLVVTAVAALLPARRASRIPPVAAMRDAATPDRPLTALTVAGLVPALGGAAAVALALFRDLGDGRLWTLIAGVLLVFVGVAMLTPAISRPVVTVLGRPLTWSVAGKLGQRNSGRNPRRTAITAATLMIGIALVTGVSVIGTSLKASLDQLTTQDLRAQLIIAGDQTGSAPATFDPAVIDRTSRIPGVRRATAVSADLGQVGTAGVPVEAGDLAAMSEVFNLHAAAGELRTLKPGEIALPDTEAKTWHLRVGGTARVVTQRGGPRDFTIVAIFERTSFLPGPVLSVADGAADFSSPLPMQGYVELAPGASADAVQRQVDGLLRDNPDVSVRSQADFAQQQASQVNSTQAILYILLALALVVAILGIVNTLALSVLERTRELGLLRAVGLVRTQVAQMVTVESVVISVFGALLGLVVGSALGAAVVRALRDFGIPVLRFSWGTAAVFVVLAVVVGLVAAIVPAVRAARTDVLKAIAYE